MIKVVYFDYGGVLTPGGRGPVSKEVPAAYFGLEVDDIKVDDLDAQLRENEITIPGYFQRLSERYGSEKEPLTEDEYVLRADIFSHNDEVYALAEKLRDSGIITGILSNVTTINSRLLGNGGSYKGFDPVILSCEVGARKPDPLMYERASQLANCQPQEIAFIDDQEKALAPARELSWHTILATSEQQIVDDVTQLLERENYAAGN